MLKEVSQSVTFSHTGGGSSPSPSRSSALAQPFPAGARALDGPGLAPPLFWLAPRCSFLMTPLVLIDKATDIVYWMIRYIHIVQIGTKMRPTRHAHIHDIRRTATVSACLNSSKPLSSSRFSLQTSLISLIHSISSSVRYSRRNHLSTAWVFSRCWSWNRISSLWCLALKKSTSLLCQLGCLYVPYGSWFNAATTIRNSMTWSSSHWHFPKFGPHECPRGWSLRRCRLASCSSERTVYM